MSAGPASGLQNSAGPAGQAGRHEQGNAPTSTPSGFNFEPASIFDWASSHHTTQHHQPGRGTASPYYQHAPPPQQQQQQQQQQAPQPTHSLDLVTALGGGNSSMNAVTGQHQDEDDDEDDEDDEDDDDGRQGKSNGQINNNLGRKRVRGSGPTHRLNRKGGGRPKDFIWAYFDEHHTPMPTTENPKAIRHSAECKACGWTCEQPKAFRMRQHVVLNCENLPDAEKQRVQDIQQQKDAAIEQKKHNKRSTSNNDVINASSAIGGGGGAGGGGNSVDAHLNGASFGDMFSRLSNVHPNNSGSGDASYFSYAALSGGPQDPSSSLAGTSGLPGTVPTAGTSVDKQGNYKTSSSSGSKKKRKKEDSTSNTVNSNWNLSSFLGGAPSSPNKMGKSPITCHVLDSSAGRPGSSIKIRMDQLGQTGFLHVATGETDADGRNNSLLPSTLKIDKNAIYKMTFYTREYFSTKGVESFYPFVEVVFEVKEPDEHHHIALLLSPYSYTTYRGS